MKPEAQRTAIAEACGKTLFVIHKPIHDPFGYYRENGHGYTTAAEAWRVTEEVGRKYVSGRPTDIDRVVLEPAPLPDYLSDLNAMNEAEKVLTGYDFYGYIEHLVGKKWFDAWTFEDARGLVRATAAERAEAFLRTLGLWVEDVPGSGA